MSKLTRTLLDIEGVEHTIHADDVTLWNAGGSDGELEARLQEAVRAPELYIAPAGLKCSSRKSELLFYSPSRTGRKPRVWEQDRRPNVALFDMHVNRIAEVNFIRVLGLIIEGHGSNNLRYECFDAFLSGVGV